MKKQHLDSKIDLAGAFWPPNEPENILTGDLRTEDGKLKLFVAPQFKRLGDADMQDLLPSFSQNPSETSTGALCGETKEGRCTLLHLHESNGRGVLNFGSNFDLNANVLIPSAAVLGLHINSSDSDEIEGAAFYLSSIRSWLPTPWTSQHANEEQTYAAPRKALNVLKFSSIALRAEIICEVFATVQTQLKKKAVIRSEPRIRIIPETPRSLNWYLDVAARVENFFTLCLGTSVVLEAIALFQEEEIGWLIQRRRASKVAVDSELFVQITNGTLTLALSNWLAVPKDEQPLEKILLGMVRVSKLFVETEFLSLAQSLEAFGRLHFNEGLISKADFKAGSRKIRIAIREVFGDTELSKRCCESVSFANESSYARRLEQIYDMLTPEFAFRLLGDREALVKTLVQTRNFYTHLGIQKGASAASGPKELFLLTRKIHALLRCIILVKLGIEEWQLRDPILRQANKWS